MTPVKREARPKLMIELRLKGLSRSQIARELGLKSGSRALDKALQGVPPPVWTMRPRAKDDVRAKATSLRKQGLSYKQIQAIVGGSASSLSLWLRSIPLTELQKAGLRRRKQEAVERTARRNHENRLAREALIRSEAIEEIGDVSGRDLFVAGVVAYAAEGSKNKPWGPARPVQFINSDPTMITLFLRWLDAIGIERERVTFRLTIHESADVEEALSFWSALVDTPRDRFHRTTLKRHNPKTPRRNVGPAYRGCLIVRVRRSTDLNRRIEGWFQALADRVDAQTAARTVPGSSRD